MKRRYFADATNYKGHVLVQVGERVGDKHQSISIFLSAAASRRFRKDLRDAEARAKQERKKP